MFIGIGIGLTQQRLGEGAAAPDLTLDADLPVPELSISEAWDAYPFDVDVTIEAAIPDDGSYSLAVKRGETYALMEADTWELFPITGADPNLGLGSITSPEVTVLKARLQTATHYGPESNTVIHGAQAPTITTTPLDFDAVEDQNVLGEVETSVESTIELGGTDGAALSVSTLDGLTHTITKASGNFDFETQPDWDFTLTPTSDPVGYVGSSYAATGTIASATGYSAEALALFDRMTTAGSTPDDTRKGHIDTFIAGLIDAGIWAKLDVLVVLAAHSKAAGYLNWIEDAFNPSDISAPTFTTDRGAQGNGSSQYVNTNFNPSTAGGNYQRDSATFGVWSRTNSLSSTKVDMALVSTGGVSQNCDLLANSASANTIRGRINSGTTTNFGTTINNSSGLIVLARAISTTQRAYRNGTLHAASAGANSTALANETFKLMRGAAGYSDRQLAGYVIGGNLDDTEQGTLYTLWAAYNTAVGA